MAMVTDLEQPSSQERQYINQENKILLIIINKLPQEVVLATTLAGIKTSIRQVQAMTMLKWNLHTQRQYTF